MDPTIMSISFSYGLESMIEISYAEERDQSEKVGEVRSISTYVDATPEMKELITDIMEAAAAAVDEMHVIRRKPVEKKRSRRSEVVEDDSDD